MKTQQTPTIDKRMSEIKKKYQLNKNLKKDNYIFVTPNFGNVPTRMPEKAKEAIKTQSVQHYLY